MISADDFIAAVRRRGNDPRNLRDAAHEAHHAIVSGAKKWDRESIHRAVKKRFRKPADRIGDEIMARAVEQIVTERITGEACGDVPKWAYMMCMEAIRDGIAGVDPDFAEKAIRSAIDGAEAHEAADRVIAAVEAIG